jgi:phosphatidylethanolamine-binding protein (PEBP) family uncharacterized protein
MTKSNTKNLIFKKILYIILSISMGMTILEAMPKGPKIETLVNMISESKAQLPFYFWRIDDASFLATDSTGEISIWYFTKAKFWQPIYNADATFSYARAGKTLLDVSFDKEKKILTIGSIDPDTIMNKYIRERLLIIRDGVHTMEYFFWTINKKSDRNSFNDSFSFLTSMKPNGENAIWHYVKYPRKWQPLHNINEYKDYPKAPKIFKSLTFDLSAGTLDIGEKDDIALAKFIETYPDEIDEFKANNVELFKTIDKMKAKGTYANYVVKMKSPKGSETTPDKTTGIVSFTSPELNSPYAYKKDALITSPSLQWSIKNISPKSFAIVMSSVENGNKKHWIVANIPSTTTSIPQALTSASINGIKFLENDFNTNGDYKRPFIPSTFYSTALKLSHNFNMTIYALNVDNVKSFLDITSSSIAEETLSFKYENFELTLIITTSAESYKSSEISWEFTQGTYTKKLRNFYISVYDLSYKEILLDVFNYDSSKRTLNPNDFNIRPYTKPGVHDLLISIRAVSIENANTIQKVLPNTIAKETIEIKIIVK